MVLLDALKGLTVAYQGFFLDLSPPPHFSSSLLCSLLAQKAPQIDLDGWHRSISLYVFLKRRWCELILRERLFKSPRCRSSILSLKTRLCSRLLYMSREKGFLGARFGYGEMGRRTYLFWVHFYNAVKKPGIEIFRYHPAIINYYDLELNYKDKRAILALMCELCCCSIQGNICNPCCLSVS